MAQAKKISELAQAGTITGLELAVVVQDGETRQTTTEQIAASVSQRLAVFEASTSAAFESLFILTSLNAVSIAAAEAAVSAFDIRVAAVSAQNTVNTNAITSINNTVSALEIRVSSVSAVASANAAAITSVNNVVSALEIRVSAASARAADNLDLINAVNGVVFNLEVRVNEVSANTSVNAAAITSINAEVSLKAYRSGDYLTNARYIEFDTSASNGNSVPGKLLWNSNDGTLDVGLYGDSILQVGQETLYYLKNGEASTISNGQLVMATSVVGNSGKLIGGLADGSGAISAEYLLGVATQSIAAGEFGYVTQFGLVRGINATGSPYSETWTQGDLLYPNASILGGLTNSPPSYPAFSMPIAIVVNAVSNAGSIFVRMKSGEYLEQLHDVDISTKAAGDVITWDTSISAWVNSQVLVQTQASVSALNVQVAAVSALTSVNKAAITSTNNVVSALADRVAVVSASVLELTTTNPVVQQNDIGTEPNQVPLNQYLGPLAYSRVATLLAPASTAADGQPGEIAYDADYFYVCVSTNVWKRVAVSTW